MRRLGESILHNVRAIFFFFNDTATTEIYTLSLHDALPISVQRSATHDRALVMSKSAVRVRSSALYMPTNSRTLIGRDRKSTRLNSSHANISYAAFCLKKNNIVSARP